MPKAIAVHAIFLVAVIAISLFFMIAIFWGWIDTTKFGVSQATCSAKKVSYCSEWSAKKKPPGWWDTKEPKDCSEFEVNKPTCSDCKSIIPTFKCT